MNLLEEFYDKDNKKHVVGFKHTEKNVEYIITIEKRIFRKNTKGEYIECLEENTDKDVYVFLKEFLETPITDAII